MAIESSETMTPLALASRLRDILNADDCRIAEQAGYGRRCGFGARPVLLIVDATYGFCGRTQKPIMESIAEQRRSCGEYAWAAVTHAADLLRYARTNAIPIIFSTMEDPTSGAYEPGLWGTKNRRGTEDAAAQAYPGQRENEIVADLAPRAGERVFAKNKPSLFSGTGLLPYLITLGADSVIIAGGTTSGCVYATALDAFSHNFKVAVAAEASFDRLQSAHWMFLCDIDLKYGDVVTCAEASAHMAEIGKKLERREAHAIAER